MTSVYDSERLATGYAFDRPPVHAQILKAARLRGRARRALDVGCGAGVSTAALAPLAEHVVGLEPIAVMLAHRRDVAPQAGFVAGSAQGLPFAERSFDLVAAAGSLNYADLPSALAEVARVLTRDGIFLLYDFSPGRQSTTGNTLATWFESFEQRFPSPPGWQPVIVHDLPLTSSGLRLDDYTGIDVALPMTFDAYLRYVVSEVNVDSALSRGVYSAEEARDWCRRTLRHVFGDGDLTVVFRGYLAVLTPTQVPEVG
jgi:SAM-dependent methyltransferase